MTRYAILADVHGRLDPLRAVLADARQRGATAFIDLGDVTSDPCYDLLRQVGAQAVFGNYEVSGWGDLSPENQAWVRELPPLLMGETFLAAHAAPYFPDDLLTVDEVMDYLLDHDVKWSALFPRMDEEEDVRWLTYAELEEQDKRLFFHGHTHVQAVWRVGPAGAMTSLQTCTVTIGARGRYVVGVGSIGQPQEGPEPRYAIYDQKSMTVELYKVG
jgi:predicted phosphodiesterase